MGLMPSSPRASRLPIEECWPSRPVLCALFVLLALTCIIQRASAEPTPGGPSAKDAGALPSESVLLLVRTRGDSGVVAQLRAELSDTGWELREVATDTPHPGPPLAALAQRFGARAAVRVDRAHETVEIWVDQQEGAVSETLRASGERLDDRVLALRTTEALRARGLEFIASASPQQDHVAAREPTAPEPDEGESPAALSTDPEASGPQLVPERSPERIGLALGPGLMLSPGGVGASAVVLASMRTPLPAAFDVSLFGLLPLSSGMPSGAEGTARVRPWLMGGALEWTFWRRPVWDSRVGVALAGARVSMLGEGSEGFRGVHDRVWAGVPLALYHLGAHLRRALRVELAAWVGASFPEIKVYFGEREAAHWGRPVVGGALTIELCPQDLFTPEGPKKPRAF